MSNIQLVHGSCATRDGHAVILLGTTGSGKSDLVLRLLGRGFQLVADDQIVLADGMVGPPPSIAGLLEVRGLGIMRLPWVESARLALVVELGAQAERLPHPETHERYGVPVIRLDANAASAPDRIIMALDCVLGRVSQVAGAFSP